MLAPGRHARSRRDRSQAPRGASPTRAGMWASLARGADRRGPRRPARRRPRLRGARSRAAAAETSPERAARRLVRRRGTCSALRGSVTDLYAQHRDALRARSSRDPGHLGWRAVAELEDWRAVEVYDERRADRRRVRRRGRAAHGLRARRAHRGTVRARRRAGPAALVPRREAGALAGRLGAGPDARQRAARARGDADALPRRGRRAGARRRVLRRVVLHDPRRAGARRRRAGRRRTSGSTTRRSSRAAPQEWGSWQRFGAHVAVADGRHRVLARALTPAASVRTARTRTAPPPGVATDGDPRRRTTSSPPRVLADPNPIDAIVRAAASGADSAADRRGRGARGVRGARRADGRRRVGAHRARSSSRTTPRRCALQMAAAFVGGRPGLPGGRARAASARARASRALAQRRARCGARSLMTILDDAEQHGLAEAVEPLRKLADEVPAEPEVLEQLARALRPPRLARRPGCARSQSLAQRFPDDVAALHAYLEALDEDGPAAEADKVAARIKKLDPDAEVDLDRALARHDYKAAIAELERLKKRRPDRKEIAARIADVLARSGDPSAAAAGAREGAGEAPARRAGALPPRRPRVRAGATRRALRRALAAALQAGASTDELRAAIDLARGRHRPRAVPQGRQGGHPRVPGLGEGRPPHGWHRRARPRLRGDLGPRRRLERDARARDPEDPVAGGHQLGVRDASRPTGLVLHLRVIKPDGRVLEPEPVAGQADADAAAPRGGRLRRARARHAAGRATARRAGSTTSPHWFFREADKGYWRSEFVVITPARPASSRSRRAATCRRRRSRRSARSSSAGGASTSARPRSSEPESPPITEFLPSVRVGWGVSLEATLAHLVDLAADETPLDPRLRAKALDIVRGVPRSARPTSGRAALYRWVLEHVQDGQGDRRPPRDHRARAGRGRRPSATCCACSGIDERARPGQEPPRDRRPLGKMSEVEQYDALVMRVTDGQGRPLADGARQVRALRVHRRRSCASSRRSCSSRERRATSCTRPAPSTASTTRAAPTCSDDGSAIARPRADLRGQPRHRMAQRARPDPAGQALTTSSSARSSPRRSTAGTFEK